MRRGDIYYIEIPYSTGHEMMKNRPGIVVTNGDRLENCTTVQVVVCSASNQRHMETHVRVASTPAPSVAMCEHIYTVDLSRLVSHLGCVSGSEMAAIDAALRLALGLREPAGAENAVAMEELQTELEFYRRLYSQVSDYMLGKRGHTT